MSTPPPTGAERAVAFCGLIALVWAGLALGISFVEAPTKFTAPTLTRLVALDVGRVVFAMSHRVQVGFTAALVASSLAARRRLRKRDKALLAALLTTFAIQLLGIQPQLDARTVRILAGDTLPGSPLHAAYVSAELIKLALLLAIGWRSLRPRPN